MRFGRIVKWIIISVLFLVVCSFISDILISNYNEVKRYTITVTNKEIQNDNNSTHYIIYATIDNGKQQKFKLNNTWYPKSSLTYHNLNIIFDCFKIDKTYVIETIGYDVPYLGFVEKIIEFESAK